MELVLDKNLLSILLEKAAETTSKFSINELKEELFQKFCITCGGSCTGCEGTCHGSGCTGTHES